MAFISGLPTKHAAKLEYVIDLLDEFRGKLPFPHSSHVTGTKFRELRTSFAGQQYRVIYRRKGRTFHLLSAFHKTSDGDVARAVRRANKYWEQIE